MNIWDILILLLIIGAAAMALRTLRGNRKNGGCTCGCGGCTKECAARQEEKPETNH